MASEALELSKAQQAEPFRFWDRRRRILYPGMIAAGVIYAAWTGLADWRDRHAFLINATESLPNWAFIIETKRAPTRGEYVFFDPPRSALVVRHFGPHPSMFGKIVHGVAGDVVTRIDRTFYVNGVKVAVAKPVSRFGEPLALGPTGTIPRGCYFVATPHKDGFDSRYAAIGWPCNKKVVGVGTPIL